MAPDSVAMRRTAVDHQQVVELDCSSATTSTTFRTPQPIHLSPPITVLLGTHESLRRCRAIGSLAISANE